MSVAQARNTLGGVALGMLIGVLGTVSAFGGTLARVEERVNSTSRQVEAVAQRLEAYTVRHP